MTRRFQFSLGRLLLATVWLALAAAGLGQLAHAKPQSSPMLILAYFAVYAAGVAGGIAAMFGTHALRHSFYGAGVTIAITLLGSAAITALVMLTK